MTFVWIEYFPILIYIVVGFALAFIIFGLSYLLALQSADLEKSSAYECGFNPFDEARSQFDVHFYLVAILFIIFDLEITFLFPWSMVLNHIGLFGFTSMFIFLFILTVGFIYEWGKGALEW
uniref:NADH dehydrogenase subunit 3 n=1 Tax=Meteora sporadica TaxID=2913902 RepID=UPI003001C558|nr:NADH dehydrogenase subunit 3 [Meteora sporadica]WVH37078.1 NADH dehydrogenase subunit 3 [Meteora sporadica]